MVSAVPQLAFSSQLTLYAVVNDLWRGNIVQKHNEGHDVECESSHPFLASATNHFDVPIQSNHTAKTIAKAFGNISTLLDLEFHGN